MDIRQLSPDYAVAPQIVPADLPAIAAAGYRTVICNRPDVEVAPDLQAARIRAAAEVAGLVFVDNPVAGGAVSQEILDRQVQAESTTPVLAYCATGTRSAVLWALTQAGNSPAEEILRATAAAGYALDGLRGHIDAMAARS